MDTAKLGPQLHLQGSAKAAPPRGRAASPQQIPHSQKTDVSTNTTTLLRVLKAPPLTASPQESNHHFDTVPKTQ